MKYEIFYYTIDATGMAEIIEKDALTMVLLFLI